MPDFDDRLRDELERVATPPKDGANKLDGIAKRRRRRRLAVRTQAVALAVVVVAGTGGGVWGLSKVFNSGKPGPSPAATPPGNLPEVGRLAFSAETDDGGLAIFTMNPDGTDLRQVTHGTMDAMTPAWSPDGTQIAFTGGGSHSGGSSSESPPLDIYVMDADGSNVRQLTDTRISDRNPVWTPDGSTIVFSSEVPQGGISAISPAGTDLRAVTDERNVVMQEPMMPTVSPDGSYVAFFAWADHGSIHSGLGLGVASLGSDGPAGWILPPGADTRSGGMDAVWSPDGTRIAYVPIYADAWEHGVDVLDLRTGEVQHLQVPSGQRWPYALVWSPDAERIAYQAFPEGGGDGNRQSAIAVMDLATGESQVVSSLMKFAGSSDVNTMSWAPDRSLAQPNMPPLRLTPFDSPPSAPDPNVPPLDGSVQMSGQVLVETWDDMRSNDHIAVMDADGSNLRPLFTSTEEESQGVWSPDGTKIAFLRNRAPELQPDGSTYSSGAWPAEIIVGNADGTHEQVIVHEASVGSPIWSPDGSRIAYLAGPRTGDNLWAVDADGANPTQLLAGFTVNAASFSPDGTKLVFASNAYADADHPFEPMEIYTANADGSGLTRLTDNRVYDQHPVWSPDGTQIAFMRSEGNTGEWNLYVMNADGTGERQLTAWPGMEDPFLWSEDGSTLVFRNTKRDGDSAEELYGLSLSDGKASLWLEGDGGMRVTDWRP